MDIHTWHIVHPMPISCLSSLKHFSYEQFKRPQAGKKIHLVSILGSATMVRATVLPTRLMWVISIGPCWSHHIINTVTASCHRQANMQTPLLCDGHPVLREQGSDLSFNKVFGKFLPPSPPHRKKKEEFNNHWFTLDNVVLQQSQSQLWPVRM